jgi:hypothetical protein
VYIFMDESGDLGFDFSKKGTSKVFVITFLFTEHKRTIEKCVRKTHAGLRRKIKYHGKALHAYHENQTTRLRMLKNISEKSPAVIAIVLNKKKVHARLQNEKAVLYNYVTNILLDRIFSKALIPPDDSIELVASRRETNKFLNANFRDYLEHQAVINHDKRLKVTIKTPADEKALQAVDFISWAIFRRHEHGDTEYYNVIREIIVEENPLFP